MKVLLVDDEKIICDGLSVIVPWEEFGFEAPDTAFNGVQALERMEKKHYDLLITDILMPLMDGLELCRKVHEEYPACTLVILSGYGDFQYAQKAIEYGVKSYLLKPVDENRLMDFLIQFRQEMTASDDRFYCCDIPVKERSGEFLSSAVEYGRESALRLSKGDMEEALHCLGDFVLFLMESRPQQALRLDYAREYLRPIVRMAEELKMGDNSDWAHQTVQNCLNTSKLSEFYYRSASLITRISALVNERMLSGKYRASDEMAAYIKEKYAEKISAYGIAGHFHLSPAYCGRLFKEEQGISILQFLHNERIAQAKILLTDTDEKIENIALRTGYTEISAFYAQFKRIMNMTPEQYRKLSRKQ